MVKLYGDFSKNKSLPLTGCGKNNQYNYITGQVPICHVIEEFFSTTLSHL